MSPSGRQTPQGLSGRRDLRGGRGPAVAARSGRKLEYTLIGLLIIAVAWVMYRIEFEGMGGMSAGEQGAIHRSTSVNLRAVERIERDVLGRSQLHLKDHPDVLAVSRAYARRFRQM